MARFFLLGDFPVKEFLLGDYIPILNMARHLLREHANQILPKPYMGTISPKPIKPRGIKLLLDGRERVLPISVSFITGSPISYGKLILNTSLDK